MNKRRIVLIAALVILASLAVGGTFAYFTSSEITHNVITTGGVEIALQEWADEEKQTPFPADGVSDVMPDTSVTKIVEIRNTGEQPAYVRVRLEREIELDDAAEGEVDIALIELVLDEENWTQQDEYYYYRKALAPGETTEPLLKSVHFKPEMGNLYQKCTVNVIVGAQAVQSANNGTSPLEAKGWPADPAPEAEEPGEEPK